MGPACKEIAARAAGLSSLVCAVALVDLPASAQADAGRLCRVRFQETLATGDTTTTSGVLEITSAAPQADGSGYFMGSGPVEITYTTPQYDRCQATNSPFTTIYQVIIESQDGRTATVDIYSFESSFTVNFQCPEGPAEYDAIMSYPPSVTLPLENGATAPYSETFRSGFARGSVEGSVSLEFCD